MDGLLQLLGDFDSSMILNDPNDGTDIDMYKTIWFLAFFIFMVQEDQLLASCPPAAGCCVVHMHWF